MWVQVGISVLALSAMLAILYRIGGIGKPFKTWMRDWLIPPILLVAIYFVFKVNAKWWAWFLSYGLMGASLTTYWDSI